MYSIGTFQKHFQIKVVLQTTDILLLYSSLVVWWVGFENSSENYNAIFVAYLAACTISLYWTKWNGPGCTHSVHSPNANELLTSTRHTSVMGWCYYGLCRNLSSQFDSVWTAFVDVVFPDRARYLSSDTPDVLHETHRIVRVYMFFFYRQYRKDSIITSLDVVGSADIQRPLSKQKTSWRYSPFSVRKMATTYFDIISDGNRSVMYYLYM